MKTAFVVDRFPSLGQPFILNQITGLIDRGHDVYIYAHIHGRTSSVHPHVRQYNLLDRTRYLPRVPDSWIRRLLKCFSLLLSSPIDIEVLLQALNVFKYRKFAVSLRVLFMALAWSNEPEYDIVHCHFGQVALMMAWLKELGLITSPLIATFHGTDINVLPRIYGNNYYKDLFRCANLCTVSSDFMWQQVKSHGLSEDKLFKLSVGIDLQKFPFKQSRLAPCNKINILTIARLIEFKGAKYSIKAVAKMAVKHPNFSYKIVGEGPLLKELQALVTSLGISDKVEFLGALPEDRIRKLFAETHIFLLAGIIAKDGSREAQGVALLEAQACGIPIVSTLVGGIPESVLDGKSGFLVAEKDVDALANRLCCLIDHVEIWPEMGRTGRKHVEEHYDINKLNDQLVELYNQVIKDARSCVKNVKSLSLV